MSQRIRLSGVDRKAIAERLKADIDAFCVQHYANDHRDHLGASEIGEKCARKLWYIFRWMHREQFDGRMLRLFNRGHQTEPRFEKWINGIGMKVFKSENGEQFHIEGASGHFGGSLDGVALLPVSYGIEIPFLAEFKTHNLRSFNKLVKDQNVTISKPKHFAQMNTYGSEPMYNFDYAIYFGLCKDNDDIYIEVVALDHEAGRKNVAKAEQIIFSQVPPGRIAASPAYSECAYCPMKGICHLGQPVDRNCRSCKFAEPSRTGNGEWECNRYDIILEKATIKTGCQDWQEIEHR